MSEAPRNILLLTIDSLRYDYSSYLASRICSRFGGVSLCAYSNGPGTTQSFPSIMSSTSFLVHGGLRLRYGIPCLSEVLSKCGYYTVGFNTNPFLSKLFGWDRGFREYYDFVYYDPFKGKKSKERAKSAVESVKNILKRSKWLRDLVWRVKFRFKGLRLPYIEARELNRCVLKWVKEKYSGDKKVFLWVHYMDVHFPYVPPEEYLPDIGFSSRKEAYFANYAEKLEKVSGENLRRLMRLYSACVKYVADSIVELLEELEDIGLLENSLLVITSDHGEAFREHGKYGHEYYILYNEVLRVPLVLSGSNVGNMELEGRVVQLIDLAPTVVDLVGGSFPPTFKGMSLKSSAGGKEAFRPVFAETAFPDLENFRYDVSRFAVSVIHGSWKLIYSRLRGVEELELYNLDKDPLEKCNVVEEHRDVAEELLELIHGHLKEVYSLRKFSKRLATIKRARRKLGVKN